MVKYEHKTTVQMLRDGPPGADGWPSRLTDPKPPTGDGWHIVGMDTVTFQGETRAVIVWERPDPRQMEFK